MGSLPNSSADSGPQSPRAPLKPGDRVWLLGGRTPGAAATVEGYETAPPRPLVRVRLAQNDIDIVDEEALVAMRSSPATSSLERLEDWYLSQCDGDWEHGSGITIGTLDNPGWSLSINLAETTLEGVPFTRIEQQESEHRWWTCWVENRAFEGRGGPQMFGRLVEVFLAWMQSAK